MKAMIGMTILCVGVWVLVIFSLGFHTPHIPLCRKPDVGTEYRVFIQHRDEEDRIIETCSIEPIDPNEGPRKTMQRLLRRQR